MTSTVTPSVDINSTLIDFLKRCCPSGLQPNLYAKIKVITSDRAINFQLESPIPSKGLARTAVSLNSAEQVYPLLLQMLMGRMPQDGSLNAELIHQLITAGVLLPQRMTPMAPRFACTVSDDELHRLWDIDNATRPQRLSPSTTNSLPDCAQLGAHHLAWMYDPFGQLDWPYWLDSAQSELLQELVCANAGSEARHWSRAFGEASSSICHSGYAIVRSVLPPEFLRSVQEYYRQLLANGFLPLGDAQSLRYHLHNEPLARWLHQHTVPLVARIIPEPIKPSYTYLGFYVAGAVLEKHTDRVQCEYTLSLTIDATPSVAAEDAWPLYADLKDGTTVEVRLGAGDGLIFKGRELPHYRHRLPEGRTSSSIFLHYVPEAFSGKLD